ncbi:hypothetical protein [Lysinibacter cavernae]|uniref:Bacterial Pleckstrin homology domain-containing protein n=1 Tax=Lysinibacter cavernae TaxID=1640652 RepID=A0A7X5TT98_9MICO|nr:hypothetical protein [Lysinibacter cavernae]NIH54396.1 hypothetical protein [Lysinibacter cavernae]
MTSRNTLHLDNAVLVVIPRGFDKLWGFRTQITVPLDSIVDVRVELQPKTIRTGLRYPGLSAFGKRSGTFHPGREKHYWNYSGRGEALAISIAPGHDFHRLYLSVENAESSRTELMNAVSARQ